MSAELLDAVGRPVLTLTRDEHQNTGPHTLSVPAQSLAAGLYTIRLLHNGAAVFRKPVPEPIGLQTALQAVPASQAGGRARTRY